jgi:hypothetical protein
MDILNLFGFSKKCEKLESTIDCFKLTNWECRYLKVDIS